MHTIHTFHVANGVFVFQLLYVVTLVLFEKPNFIEEHFRNPDLGLRLLWLRYFLI